MDEEEDLYKEIIVDHSRHPRNHRVLATCTHHHHGVNPLCGDEIEIQLRLDPSGEILDVGFQGSGCAISQASASMLTQLLKGASLSQAQQWMSSFKSWMKNRESGPCPEELGDFEALSGVRNYPVRVKCALLAWSTLEQALK